AEERVADSAAALAAGEIVLVPVAEELGDLVPAADAVFVSPGGRRALFTSDVGPDLWCLDVDSGRSWEALTGLPRVTSLEFLDGDQVMVKTDPWLGVYGFEGDRLVRLAARETEAGPATAWGGGRVLLAGTVDAPGIVVYGWCDGVLARLAELSAPVDGDRVRVVGDRAFAADRITFELANLGPAWDRFAGWVRHRAATTAAAGGVVVEEVADAPPHGICSAPDAVRTLVLYRWAHGGDGPPVEVGRAGLPNGGKVHYLGWAAGGRILHVTAGGYTSFLAVADGRLYPVGAFPARDWFHVWARGCAL